MGIGLPATRLHATLSEAGGDPFILFPMEVVFEGDCVLSCAAFRDEGNRGDGVLIVKRDVGDIDLHGIDVKARFLDALYDCRLDGFLIVDVLAASKQAENG